jgi:hypothetical protein
MLTQSRTHVMSKLTNVVARANGRIGTLDTAIPAAWRQSRGDQAQRAKKENQNRSNRKTKTRHEKENTKMNE